MSEMETMSKIIFIALTALTITNLSAHETISQKAAQSTCERGNENNQQRYLLYNVNPGEGFNLRRDVYLRVANLIHRLNDIEPWTLVLPPWGSLYHWRNTPKDVFHPWEHFFDLSSLSKWIPVMELDSFLKDKKTLDSGFILQNFEDMWEREWVERFKLSNCTKQHKFRHYSNGTWGAKIWNRTLIFSQFSCLSMQGQSSTIIPFLTKDQQESRSVYLDHAEVLLHDEFGTFKYWAARRSMKFASHLVEEANDFRQKFLDSDDARDKTESSKTDWRDFKPRKGTAVGGPYLATHMRRTDFLYARKDEVPSIKEAANQLRKLLKKLKLNKLFVASDAPIIEIEELRNNLIEFEVFLFSPSNEFRAKYGDGGVAIVDQIICSHARYFIGTWESTFTFRIQEEREILGFAPDTTFNRLCGDTRKCSKPTRWEIVYR